MKKVSICKSKVKASYNSFLHCWIYLSDLNLLYIFASFDDYTFNMSETKGKHQQKTRKIHDRTISRK